MTVNINKPQINLREQLKKLERPTTDMLAVKGHDGVLLDPLTGDLNLQGIDTAVGDGAVEVFIYDTRKDSDGGAWRKRTQDTSWYNETLGTSVRGTRKEFPAVAVIVAEGTKVTIYDGDDPAMPMWMVFDRASSAGWTPNTTNILGVSYSEVTSCAAKNGLLVVSMPYYSDVNNGAVIKISFLEDAGYHHFTQAVSVNYPAGRYGKFRGNIAERNIGKGHVNINDTAGIVQANANDLAMTVLPNAPIDSATGLPVPTIAVGTNGGVSVIKDYGNVISTVSSSHAVLKVDFTDDYGINAVLSNGANGNFGGVYVNDIESINGLTYQTYANWDAVIYQYKYGDKVLTFKASGINDAPCDFIDLKNRSSAIGIETSGGGLTLLEKSPKDAFDPDGGMVAFVTSDYNTGYMPGDIKGAFLSDTDTTAATELVTNGYFSGSVDNWIAAFGTATLSADRLLVTAPNGGSSWGYAYQAITTEVGKTYKISLYYDRGSADGRLVVKNDSTNSSAGLLEGEDVNAGGWRDLGAADDASNIYAVFTATAPTTYILLFAKSLSGGTSAYDNVSVTPEIDRSANRKGLQVHGTVTKTSVAAGADLVAYSGFSASNRLESLQNDVNFGSSPNATICFISWVNQSTTGQYSYIISVQDGTSTAPVGIAAHTSTGNFYVYDGTTVSSSSTNIVDGNWHHCVGIINGTSVIGYVDGREVIHATTANPPNLSGIDRFNIGHFRTGTSNMYHQRGSLALSRISKSILSAEQVKKMYEDEKTLFQENAKATLYGSSDAVTALAHDDTTNLLHVGTSGGRSTFSGLKRVENTTTSVITAISASNGLVAEQ